jgi:NADPH:quinone reductase-like Zn-dependent oxidoreductase
VAQATNGTMKAAAYFEYGAPEVLQYVDLPRPTPGPGEVLVRVRAVSLNAFDLMARAGRYTPNKGVFPHVLGSDISGEIAAIGPEVREPLRVGQRITAWWVVPCGRCEQCVTGNPNICAFDYKYLGAHLWGGYAQYLKLPAFNVIPLPESVSWEEGAAFPTIYGTAWHMLVTQARLRPGETVLIQAAGAGVSVAGIQIAKLAGATVYATASSDAKLERARALGADAVINYQEQDFQQEVLRLTGKRGVDLVFDHVGGDVFEKSIRSLTRGGRLVTCGGTATYDVSFNIAYVFHKQLQIIGSNSATKRELEEMMPLLGAGKLRPIVDRVFPLPEAAAAHHYLADRRNFGKVVLVPEH